MDSFSGTYYKHQKGGQAAALIAGKTADHAFIQVITNTVSHYFRYPLWAYKSGKAVEIGTNVFSEAGIKVRIKQKGVSISGELQYHGLTPLRYDIMGPFMLLPMQCRHKITSLHHRLTGSMSVCGETMDFTGGTGYIEGDSGSSFPEHYSWLQCNAFPEKACVTVSVADIPFLGMHFPGCICVVHCKGTEYRLATYLGAKILCRDEKRIRLVQGRLRLEIDIEAGAEHTLIAPAKGQMSRQIREQIVCGARFRFLKNGQMLFDAYSKYASFEYV